MGSLRSWDIINNTSYRFHNLREDLCSPRELRCFNRNHDIHIRYILPDVLSGRNDIVNTTVKLSTLFLILTNSELIAGGVVFRWAVVDHRAHIASVFCTTSLPHCMWINIRRTSWASYWDLVPEISHRYWFIIHKRIREWLDQYSKRYHALLEQCLCIRELVHCRTHIPRPSVTVILG